MGIDTCPECGELRKPVSTYSHYSNPATGYSQTTHHVATYHCKHEIDETYKHQQGCNTGTTFKSYKDTGKKLAKINKIAGVESSNSIHARFPESCQRKGETYHTGHKGRTGNNQKNWWKDPKPRRAWKTSVISGFAFLFGKKLNKSAKSLLKMQRS